MVKAAPLYVQYKKKRHEYRVHVFGNQNTGWSVIDVTQKKKRKGFENVNTKIRNHKNGWIYAREGIIEPKDLRQQALNAAFCANLPFAAIDIIWNELEDKCYVLEVNTAPGLDGTTLSNYTDAFVKDITK
jgi:D-alanine-D-alanine ligase-like ATP-grasp enzyme